MTRAWIYLMIAGLFEIIWAVTMKYTDGLTKFTPTVITFTAMVFSIFFLSQSLKTIPLGTAYSIWTGIGAAGTFIIGIFFLGESKSIERLICAMMIILGVMGLKLFYNK